MNIQRRHDGQARTPSASRAADSSGHAWSLALGAALLLPACATEPLATAPRPIAMASSSCTQPPYPAEARLDEAEGTTRLEFEVNPPGKVTRVVILQRSGSSGGHQRLDALALDTLSKCSFPAAPGFLSATSRVEFVWRLRD